QGNGLSVDILGGIRDRFTESGLPPGSIGYGLLVSVDLLGVIPKRNRALANRLSTFEHSVGVHLDCVSKCSTTAEDFFGALGCRLRGRREMLHSKSERHKCRTDTCRDKQPSQRPRKQRGPARC